MGNMKKAWGKISIILVASLCCLFLAACGGSAHEEDIKQAEGTEGTSPEPSGDASQGLSAAAATPAPAPTQDTPKKKDIMFETEQIFDMKFVSSAQNPEDDTENLGRNLNVQFYKGEPVVLWLKEWEREVILSVNADGTWETEMRDIEDGGVYLSRMDGSRELLIPAGDFLKENFWLEQNNSKFQQYKFILDNAGNCFARTNYQDENLRDHFLKIERDGEVVYDIVVEDGYYAEDFCTAPDGRTYVVLSSNREINNEIVERLVAFDPDTGKLSAPSLQPPGTP